MKLTDLNLISKFKTHVPRLGLATLKETPASRTYQEVLLDALEKMLRAATPLGDEFSLLTYSSDRKRAHKEDIIFDLWMTGILGALHALKWHDRRENPGRNSLTTTPPITDEVVTYYKKLRGYEPLLYASDHGYRDHFAHVLRVWMLGVVVACELNSPEEMIPIKTLVNDVGTHLFNETERLAVFTVAALTHDMGYPLQKVANVNSAVDDMLRAFGGVQLSDLEFTLSPPHHQIAQDTIRLISSRPRLTGSPPIGPGVIAKRTQEVMLAYDNATTASEYENANKESKEKLSLVLRCQWKYYQKYARALERTEHGFLSALLLQRKLLFFREGEFAFEEDYHFALEEIRQFMIRREILRAVATHTCPDIYFVSSATTEALLFFCDEIQDWARPRFDDLYAGDLVGLKKEIYLHAFGPNQVSWELQMGDPLPAELFSRMALGVGRTLYTRLRSAPDSLSRKFAVKWTFKCKVNALSFRTVFDLSGSSRTFTCRGFGPRATPMNLLEYLDNILTGRRSMEACRTDLTTKIEKLSP